MSNQERVEDFTLTGTHDGEIKEYTLSEMCEDGPAVLVFYVYDFSPVCTTQMCEVDDMEFLPLDEDLGVYGISTDGPYSHREFAETHDLSYPLLSDDDKTVYERFGPLEIGPDGSRQPRRGIAVVDADRRIQYRWAAGDNWDDWETEQIDEAYRTASRLIAG